MRLAATEITIIEHTCGHAIGCPDEYLTPSRRRQEAGRPCRSCRRQARAAAAIRNRKRGLPELDGTACTPDQLLKAEELRDAFAERNPAWRNERDPIRWIAEFSRRPAGETGRPPLPAEEAAAFDRIFA